MNNTETVIDKSDKQIETKQVAQLWQRDSVTYAVLEFA